jgi:putative membrane protein insertion efficiency factor
VRSESRSAVVRLALAGIWAYRVLLSPLVGGTCRFVPSCSAYAEEALARHGFRRGTWLALRRLARCHPLGGWGHDPVPLRTDEGVRRAG